MNPAIARTLARQLSECSQLSEADEIFQHAMGVMKDAGFHVLEIKRILATVPETVRLLMQTPDADLRASFARAAEFASQLLPSDLSSRSDSELAVFEPALQK
jgi:hypothetical protein